jgi:membrane-associated phospholipid phosphatase
LLFPICESEAQESDVEKAGKILRIGLPVSALTLSLVFEDEKEGAMQAVATFGTTFFTTHLLKRVINKDRSDGEKYAFPSGHTSIAFSSAAFMHKRYGWKYGIPFYILAGYVGWSLVYADRHDYWDVLGGTAVGTGCAYLFTRPYEKNKIDVMFNKSGDFYMIEVGYKF